MWNQLFGIRRSVRYHDRRTTHFERLHRLTNLLTIMLAGVVLTELLGVNSPLAIKIASAVGAVLGAADLLVGFSRRADLHRDFKRRYVRLEQKAVRGVDVGALQDERLDIESEEPPVYRALDLLCHNELCAAYGAPPEQFAQVPWYMRLTASWLHWPNAGAAPESSELVRSARDVR